VTRCEAQCWIALFHLTCNNVCREQYGLNTFRKEQLLRLRKFLNEVVIDQLPVLADVMRYMDELTILNVPESTSSQSSCFLMQQVAVLRESLMKNVNWEKVAQSQFHHLFSPVTDAHDADLRRISDVFTAEGIEDVYGDPSPGGPDPLSRPVDKVVLSLRNGQGATLQELILVRAEGSDTEVDTEHGKFRRWKMEREGGEDVPTELSPGIAAVVARVCYGGPAPFQVEKTRAVELPPVPAKDEAKPEAKRFRKKVWVTLGGVEEKIVLQIQIHWQADEHRKMSSMLRQVFLSQPISPGVTST